MNTKHKLTYLELQALHKSILDTAESNRRERPTMDAIPPADGTPDYAQFATMLDIGVAHWDEGVPSGQRARVEYAAQCVVRGVQGMTAWLRAKGYVVPDLSDVNCDGPNFPRKPAPQPRSGDMTDMADIVRLQPIAQWPFPADSETTQGASA